MNKKTFLILLGLGLLSVMCVIPYIVTLQGDMLASLGISLPILFATQFIQCLFLFSIAIFTGLRLIPSIKFPTPLTLKWNTIIKERAPVACLWGIIVAFLIYFLDALFTALGTSITTHAVIAPAWQTLLAALYGGITEEILMRLFLMTLFVWIGMKITRKSDPTNSGVYIAILLAAIIFGLGHLPITAALTTITPMVITRAIVLNGVGGIVFGILYWKKGLESAMLAHFTTDIWLLTLLPHILDF